VTASAKKLGPPWPASVVEGVAAILGDTEDGLTDGEIERLLTQLRLPDPGPITKRLRISHALLGHQASTKGAAPSITFITEVMTLRSESCDGTRMPRRCGGYRRDFEEGRVPRQL
jgi:hypothetical protein